MQLIFDLGIFVKDLLSKENLTIIFMVSGVVWKFYQSIRKKLDAADKANIALITESLELFKTDMNNKYKDMQLEILRLQIMQGIDTHRLSENEVLFFYDKYHSMGGDSFVTDRVNDYVKQLKEEEHERSKH